jgi:SAM-dependent methyltransferase
MSLLPSTHDQFRSKAYWDSFFAERDRAGGAFEWYGRWSDIRAAVTAQERLRRLDAVRALVVGCGNSQLSADLHDAGFGHVTSVDFSETVISQMRERNEARSSRMQWDVMDVRHMTYPDASFDAVFDKVRGTPRSPPALSAGCGVASAVAARANASFLRAVVIAV